MGWVLFWKLPIGGISTKGLIVVFVCLCACLSALVVLVRAQREGERSKPKKSERSEMASEARRRAKRVQRVSSTSQRPLFLTVQSRAFTRLRARDSTARAEPNPTGGKNSRISRVYLTWLTYELVCSYLFQNRRASLIRLMPIIYDNVD